MDPALALLAIVVVQALDILGHLINGAKLRKAEKRLDEAEARGVRIEAALAAITLPVGDDADEMSERMSAVRAARETKKDAVALMETTLLADLTERFGEQTGPAIMEFVRVNAPEAWNRAKKNPKSAMVILSPMIAMAERVVAKRERTEDEPRRSTGGYGI